MLHRLPWYRLTDAFSSPKHSSDVTHTRPAALPSATTSLHHLLYPQLSAPPPSHANTALQSKRRAISLLLESLCASTLHYYKGGNSIHFPMLIPFSISHPALNHGCPSEWLQLTGTLWLPWAATRVITTLQKALGCHFCFHGNKY